MKNNLSLKNDVYPLLRLAIPFALIGIVQSSLGFCENIFLAQLGETVLAASALVTWLFATLIVVLFGLFGAVNILTSHKHGANDTTGIALVFRDGLLLAALLTIPTFWLFWNVSSIFILFGQSPELVALATLYLHALAWGLFPKFILIILFELALGLGLARAMMIFTLLSIPLYILFSFVLIFGRAGFPALGIAGAGWGMTFADWIIAITAYILLFFHPRYRLYTQFIFTLTKPAYLWEMLYLGVPMGLMYCVEVGFFFAITLVMGVISIQSLAANQVTMQYLGIVASVIFNTAHAITVRMGHQLGANQVPMAKQTAIAGVMISAIFTGIIALFYWFIPTILISVDFDLQDPNRFDTVHLATQFLFIAAFFQIFESIRIALFGALRALKETHFTLLTSIISFWLIALPVGYGLATYFQLKGAGLWWGMVIGASISVLLLHWRFRLRMAHHLNTYERKEASITLNAAP